MKEEGGEGGKEGRREGGREGWRERKIRESVKSAKLQKLKRTKTMPCL